MSSATPAPAPRYPVRWGDTQAGRAENWVRGLVFGENPANKFQNEEDFTGMMESIGATKAKRVMREGMENNV